MRRARFHLLLLYSLVLFIGSCSHKTGALKFKNGKEIVSTLDSLFTELETASTHPDEFPLIYINEQIRGVIEGIGSPRIVAEIQTKYIAYEHDFSFLLSADRKIALFSWQTHLEKTETRIKNIALYRSNDKMVPTSLYGIPFIYNGIHQIEMDNSDATYLLEGRDSLKNILSYHLHAYLLKNDHIEEAPLFPDFQSSITAKVRADSVKMGEPSGIVIKNKGQRIQIASVYGSSQWNSLAFDGKKYVSDQGVELNSPPHFSKGRTGIPVPSCSTIP
ncbi:hypothetical protein V1387_12890 [Allomuricauda taeanensis]|uniref:hypothetical protein n=1 Tax=Flagellimonas taeanensis TaxID=1005926 RepID=UPI002E7C43A7|nr:hypothetical protein [Allomuricauda taeanensis]MEE1963586.1 hypothetical protein [Allomuricauda taeanensis]